MVYVQGEWTQKELNKLFNFAPEEIESSNPDVLYSGELIDVESGGIKSNQSQQAPQIFVDSSIEDPMYYSIGAIHTQKHTYNSRRVTDKSRASMLVELTGKYAQADNEIIVNKISVS